MLILLSISLLANLLFLYGAILRRINRQYLEVMCDDRDEQEGTGSPHDRPQFRRFIAERAVDVTGISGTGVPVEGCQFSDGTGVTHWLNQAPMFEPKTEVWHHPFKRNGPDPFTKISGHNGSTKVVWLD